MPAERYFLDVNFIVQESFELKGSEFHHFAHVMRSRKGDEIELVNGQGDLAEGVVIEVKRDQATIRIEKVFKMESYHPKLILAQALSKQNRLDTVLEKGTELGVDEFWLFPGMLSSKKEFFPQQMDRVRAVTIAAMKQSGRLFLPKVHFLPELDSWKRFECDSYFGDLSPRAVSFREVLHAKDKSQMRYPGVFIIGPEGGFTEGEVEILYNLGSVGVRLHSNVLRTDTAAIAGLSILSFWMQD